MGLFASKKAVAALAFRLGELSSEVRTMTSTIRSLELEYIELYDKVRHQMSRMAKRAAVEPALPINDEEVVEVDDGLDPISRKILARRGARRANL